MIKNILISLYILAITTNTTFASKETFNFKQVNLKDCYDGDTCKFNIKDLPDYLNPMSVRLYGVDTPEIRGGNQESKVKAQEARLFTQNTLKQADNIELIDCKKGKYFRLVCKIYADNKDLSQELIQNNLAVSYYGGKR